MTGGGVAYTLSLAMVGLIVYLTENGEAAWQDFRRWRMARLRRR
jgi:hypothetical protein